MEAVLFVWSESDSTAGR